MVNHKIMVLLFIVTLALASCTIDQSVFEKELQITDRAADPTISPAPGTFAQNSIEVTLSSSTPDATILYTLDGTSPVNLNDFSSNVAAFWDAFGKDASCRQIYYELYDTVYDDVQGEHSDSWTFQIGGHIAVGNLEQATVEHCVDTLTVFSDPQYESLDHLLTAVDPAGVDSCVEVFTVMNNTIITDINSWIAEAGEKDDEVLSSCLEVFELWNDTVGSDIKAMAYSEPITITEDTTIRAVAYRDDHLPSNPIEARYVLTGAVNQPPTVSLTSPSEGSEFYVGQTVSLVASASDVDGFVDRVEFLMDGGILGQSTSAPWTFSWSPTSEGTYSFSARAYDNEGARSVSSTVSVTFINPPPENVPPTVALTSPRDGAVYQSDEPIQLRAAASDSDGTVERVEFYRGSQLIHTVENGAYEYNQPALTPGDYSFKAKAYDNDGASAESNTVTVKVNSRPNVALIRPTDGAEYEEGQTVYVEANATDSDGDISKVEFLLNENVVSTDLAAPFTTQLTNLVGGTYELRARATDNDGATRTSSPVTFSVTAPTIPNQPPSVSLTSPSAGSEFYVGDTVSLVASASDSDGNVVRVEFFVDGTKVGERTSSPWSVSWSPQNEGSYDLSARATDNDGAQATSSVVQVSVVSPSVVNVYPTVALTSPQDGAVYNTTDSIPLAATASDSDGYITKVEFLVDGLLHSTDVTVPYTGTLSGLSEGTYSLRARATDNDGASKTSSAVDIHVRKYVAPPVEEDTPPPIIRFLTPTLRDLFTRFSNALINIEAIDYQGNPVRVDLYATYTHFASRKDTIIQIGTLTEPPYDFEFPRLREGTYTFVGRATDSKGQSTEARVEIKAQR